MKKFNPSDDYENLKKQAFSLYRYVKALENEKLYWEDRYKNVNVKQKLEKNIFW